MISWMLKGGCCEDCKYPIVVTQSPTDDYHYYCSNKSCTRHEGEHLGDQDDCDWAMKLITKTVKIPESAEYLFKMWEQLDESKTVASIFQNPGEVDNDLVSSWVENTELWVDRSIRSMNREIESIKELLRESKDFFRELGWEYH